MSTEGDLESVDVSRVLELLEDPVMGTFRVFGVPDTRPIYQKLLQQCPVKRTEHGGVYVFSMDANLDVNRRRDVLGNGGSPTPSNGQQRPLLPLDLDGPSTPSGAGCWTQCWRRRPSPFSSRMSGGGPTI